MAILPIDSGRYATPEMRRIFEEDSKLQRMLEVEAALAMALAERGLIPRGAAEAILAKASTRHVTVARVKEIEERIQHDVMAVVEALSEAAGEVGGGYVHFGATSNDITDTALALQLRDGLSLILKRLDELEGLLSEKASKYRGTIMMGRTHGQHALPITLGLKFAVWMREVSRHIARLTECGGRVAVGKMSGAVGTQAGWGGEGVEIQRLVMERLGLGMAEVSTQILQRDRHAELISHLALVASSLEKFALEIRELQRPEIGEVAEAFDMEKQVGSSTMPHKTNPIISERVCGLARVVRSLVTPAMENMVVWHERDLTQSSAERILIPMAMILTDYMLKQMARVLSHLQVEEGRMKGNLEVTGGRFMSESVMLALTRKGMGRQEAHEAVRRLAMKSQRDHRPFKEILLGDEGVRRYLTPEEVEGALEPQNYLGTALRQIEAAVEKTKAERARRVGKRS